MQFREANQVKWVGVRPAHRGTQYIFSAVNVINDSVPLITVDAGELFHLTHFWFSVWTSAAGAGVLRIKHDGGALSYILFRIEDDGAFRWGVTGDFNPPLEVPATDFIEVSSSADTTEVGAGIVGWNEPV